MPNLWRDKLIRFYIIIFAANAFFMSGLAALATINDFSKVTPVQWTVIIFAILGNFTGTLLAFMNKNGSKLEQGELPINGNTEFVEKKG